MSVTPSKAVRVVTRTVLSLIGLLAILPVAVIGFFMVWSDESLGNAFAAVGELYADMFTVLSDWIRKS